MDGRSAPPSSQRRQLGWSFWLVLGAALAVTAVGFVATAGWNRWDLGQLLAITILAVGSDLTSVQPGVGKLRVSGTGLGLMLAAVLLGGGPAALVGVLTIAIGWFRWREPSSSLAVNLVSHAMFPLASGIAFHAVTHGFGVGPDSVAYYFLVLPAFVVNLVVNFAGVTAYQCYLRRCSFLEKTREWLLPVLPAELFSALLVGVTVYFVVKTGTLGIAILVVVLAIFQYLVGELLKSQERAEELRRKATTDELTGLANRERFHAVMAEKIAAAGASSESFAVMLIDLDRFKEINDTLGHHYGDVLLRDLGPRLAEHVGSDGLVARLGGDEFAVLPGVSTGDPNELAEIATDLLECVQQPMAVDELTLDVGASVGIARFPVDGENGHDLLRRADVAMYAAKEEHSDFKLYAARLDRYSVRRLTVLSDFRRALESDEFVLYYQPVVDLEDREIRGAEALVRWQHPELGLVLPTDFVPIAEQSGMIGRLTRYVLRRAIAQCADWRANGHDLGVAVNLSVRDLLDRDLPGEIDRILDEYELPAEAVHVEITESMIMSDPDRALATVTRLRELGLRISVDDFGTGFSSLSNLKQLPINDLKIDRSFISSLLHDDSNQIIVRSTINLGHDLGLNVIAEGVEDQMTLKRLDQLGCDLAQGNYLGPPLSVLDFAAALDAAYENAGQAASA